MMDAQVKSEIALLASSITDLQNRVRALEDYDADDYEDDDNHSWESNDDAYQRGRSELLDALLPVIEIAIRHDRQEAVHHLRLAGLTGPHGTTHVALVGGYTGLNQVERMLL